MTYLLKINAGVRYWEDATVNGIEDDAGTMIYNESSNSDSWVVEMEFTEQNGRVLRWPEGMEASIHYKVCDAGIYELTMPDGTRYRKSGYVPSEFLCHGGTGYGDYIILNINGQGFIENYSFDGFFPEDHGDDWELVK